MDSSDDQDSREISYINLLRAGESRVLHHDIPERPMPDFTDPNARVLRHYREINQLDYVVFHQATVNGNLFQFIWPCEGVELVFAPRAARRHPNSSIVFLYPDNTEAVLHPHFVRAAQILEQRGLASAQSCFLHTLRVYSFHLGPVFEDRYSNPFDRLFRTDQMQIPRNRDPPTTRQQNQPQQRRNPLGLRRSSTSGVQFARARNSAPRRNTIRILAVDRIVESPEVQPPVPVDNAQPPENAANNAEPVASTAATGSISRRLNDNFTVTIHPRSQNRRGTRPGISHFISHFTPGEIRSLDRIDPLFRRPSTRPSLTNRIAPSARQRRRRRVDISRASVEAYFRDLDHQWQACTDYISRDAGRSSPIRSMLYLVRNLISAIRMDLDID